MIKENKSLTLSTLNDQTLFEPVPFCKSSRAQTSDDATTWKEGEEANCLNTFDIGETRCNELIVGVDVYNKTTTGDKARTLDSHYYLGCGARGGKEREIIGERITYCTTHGSFHTKAEEEEADTIQATDYKDPPIVNDMVETQYIVRRLTPTECGRLQGMPDWWCSDIEHSDAAEYKMWGNGMALPNILYVVENTVRVLQKRRI